MCCSMSWLSNFNHKNDELKPDRIRTLLSSLSLESLWSSWLPSSDQIREGHPLGTQVRTGQQLDTPKLTKFMGEMFLNAFMKINN